MATFLANLTSGAVCALPAAMRQRVRVSQPGAGTRAAPEWRQLVLQLCTALGFGHYATATGLGQRVAAGWALAPAPGGGAAAGSAPGPAEPRRWRPGGIGPPASCGSCSGQRECGRAGAGRLRSPAGRPWGRSPAALPGRVPAVGRGSRPGGRRVLNVKSSGRSLPGGLLVPSPSAAPSGRLPGPTRVPAGPGCRCPGPRAGPVGEARWTGTGGRLYARTSCGFCCSFSF